LFTQSRIDPFQADGSLGAEKDMGRHGKDKSIEQVSAGNVQIPGNGPDSGNPGHRRTQGRNPDTAVAVAS